MDTLNISSNQSKQIFGVRFKPLQSVQAPLASPPSQSPLFPRTPVTGSGAGLSSLLQGLEQNYATSSEEDNETKTPIQDASAKVEKVTETVSTPTNQAATLAQTVSEGKPAEKLAQAAGKMAGNGAQGQTEKALQSVGNASTKVGKVGESAFLLAKPFSIGNGVKELASGEGKVEDKVSTAATLGSDLAYSSQALGAAAEGGSGASKIAAIASAQNGIATAAPKLAGTLATVGKAAPVIGGVAGVIGGGLEIRDAVKGDKVDKVKLASGGLKVASGVALAIPGGLPVAMGLGAAALVIDNRENIAKGAKAVGKGVAAGAKVVGKGAAEGAKAVGKNFVTSAKVVGTGAKIVGQGAQAVSKGATDGAKAVGKSVGSGAKKVGKFAKSLFG